MSNKSQGQGSRPLAWLRQFVGGVVLAGVVVWGISMLRQNGLPTVHLPAAAEQGSEEQGLEVVAGMVRIRAGRFQMGSDFTGAADQRPAHEVQVSEFWLDRHSVTNQQFATFVAATGYLTTAEQVGQGHVFDREQKRWVVVKGAQWRRPAGPASSIAGRDDQPVVQVSWYDAVAYARWADRRLPTEAEWEYAARGGLFDAEFPWGREETPDGEYRANYWQGHFPIEGEPLDGFAETSPVSAFPMNRFGMFDMAGNVWQWCGDCYRKDFYRLGRVTNPQGPETGEQRVRRGGSWLTPAESGAIGVAARGHATPSLTTNDLGFRCARSTRPKEKS